MTFPTSTLSEMSLAFAAMAAILIVAYLVRRPPLTTATKVWLFAALGALPVGAAMAGNVQGFEETKRRHFCGSCHVMGPYKDDSEDWSSHSLASRHGRNKLFGDENCYACHADYGMFGTIVTKIGGLRHVWLYYTEYKNVSLEEARDRIHILRPFPNESCMQCHSTAVADWRKVPDHESVLRAVRGSEVSCASAGCHGWAHPFTKPASLPAKPELPPAPCAGGGAP